MSYEELLVSLKESAPPLHLPPLVEAMWWTSKGDWNRAHEIAQGIDSPDAAWIHAYLHRKEGDTSNAGYWYGKAGKPLCETSPEEEWAEITQRIIEQ